MIITKDLIEGFSTDGAVLLKGVFRDWVEVLRGGIERNLQEPGPYQRIYTPSGGAGRFVGDYCNWSRIPEYRDFVFKSPAAEIARQLMGSRTARFFHEHILVKEPGTRELTPWHHDQPYN
jgi:ectoine hydroxylase-related dioxygenase (phytanoyl-CoA dioxygenase family)